jgi:hypothetical protein
MLADYPDSGVSGAVSTVVDLPFNLKATIETSPKNTFQIARNQTARVTNVGGLMVYLE